MLYRAMRFSKTKTLLPEGGFDGGGRATWLVPRFLRYVPFCAGSWIDRSCPVQEGQRATGGTAGWVPLISVRMPNQVPMGVIRAKDDGTASRIVLDRLVRARPQVERGGVGKGRRLLMVGKEDADPETVAELVCPEWGHFAWAFGCKSFA